MTSSKNWLVWPENLALSLLILAVLAMAFLYVARDPMHSLIRALGLAVGGPLRMAARWLGSMANEIHARNKAVLESYGPDVSKPGTFAANCLQARRLAEKGVRFIQLYHQDWDHHGSLPSNLPKLCKETDQPAAALISDLKARGMLDDTLVVFGETASIDGTVNGDVIAFVRYLTVRGAVWGNIIGFGQRLEITGTVDGAVIGFASSLDGDFNFDFNVSFTEAQQREGIEYNYRRSGNAMDAAVVPPPVADNAAMAGTDAATYTRARPGMSAFVLENGVVYHTYSTYARGLDALWGMYQWLDRAPRGRNETGVWWRRRDEYGAR